MIVAGLLEAWSSVSYENIMVVVGGRRDSLRGGDVGWCRGGWVGWLGKGGGLSGGFM